jgi:aspartate kinase
VAFAAAFDAERCDIYTDVDGVYTTDPRISSKARKLDKIAFEEMLELASLGAKVLQTRSVELAMRFNVRLRVLSSFEDPSDTAGTLVCAEEEIMESNVVAGVAYSRDEAKMTLISVADRPGIAAAIFGPLSEAGVNVDMIVQNISEDGRTDMTFSCPTDQVLRAEKAMQSQRMRATSTIMTWWQMKLWQRSLLWASACAAMRVWPHKCSARSTVRGSILRLSQPPR